MNICPLGYVVQRGLNVKITNLDMFEKIYSGLTKQGVNSMSGVRFETSNQLKYRDEARLKAIQQAKRKPNRWRFPSTNVANKTTTSTGSRK